MNESSAQVVVTGASRGIGAAIAAQLVSTGYRVVGLSRSGDAPAGVAMTSLACDMTDEDSVKRVLAQIAQTGPINALINNAGLHLSAPSHALPTSDYEQVMAINATSVMVAAREIYPYLKSHGGGTIVNIGSFFDKLGVVNNLAYCASKAAVGAITRCLAVEWAADQVRVINIAPGYIETDLNKDFLARESVRQWLGKRIPTGQPGKADEVARMVSAVLDDRIPFLTGETIYLDGGQGINH